MVLIVFNVRKLNKSFISQGSKRKKLLKILYKVLLYPSAISIYIYIYLSFERTIQCTYFKRVSRTDH